MPFQNASQMYKNALNPVKGWYALSALTKSAPLHPALLQNTDVLPAGRVAVLDDLGRFVLAGYEGQGGVAGRNLVTQMPIFLWQGAGDLDVNAYNPNWYGISPTGVAEGLVATGGYEVQTTEFDETKTYKPNDLLTVTTGDEINEAGKLVNGATPFEDWIVGVCATHTNWRVEDGHYGPGGEYEGRWPGSQPVGYNAHGVKVLSFWTYFLPASLN